MDMINLLKKDYDFSVTTIKGQPCLRFDNFEIFICENKSYSEIVDYINSKMEDLSEVCSICNQPMKKEISCPSCYNVYCQQCYINSYREGHGIILCPHNCNYKFGYHVDNIELEVRLLKLKLGW